MNRITSNKIEKKKVLYLDNERRLLGLTPHRDSFNVEALKTAQVLAETHVILIIWAYTGWLIRIMQSNTLSMRDARGF